MVHLLPVVINFTLIGLYLRRVSWTPPLPTTNVLNALQFAAKVHETIMVASLATILLHHIRYRLLSTGQRGVPLGMMTSPFRLLDITYLWSREFLATLRNPRRLRPLEVITIIIHVFLFTLAAVLGPASAISMLPRLGEWELAKTITDAPFYSIHDQTIVYQAYIGAELSDIFPKVITASFNPEACDHSNLSLPQTNNCPRFGLTDILQGILLSETSGSGYNVSPAQKWFHMAEYNITIQAHHQAVPTRVISLMRYPFEGSPQAPSDEDFGAVVDVTTHTDAILSLTKKLLHHYLECWSTAMPNDNAGTIYSFVSGGERPAQYKFYARQPQAIGLSSAWKQPYVSSICSKPGVGHAASNSMTFNFQSYEGTTPYIATLDAELLFMVLRNTGMGFINISDLNTTPSFTPSAALAFTSQLYTTLCLVKAYWIDSNLSGSQFEYDERSLAWDWQATEDGHSTCNGCRFRAEDAWFDHTNATEIIHLDLDWLSVLDHGTDGDSTSKHGFFNKVRRACLGSSILGNDDPDNIGNNPDLICIAAGLGAGIAEGLSKLPYHVGMHAIGTHEDWPSNAITFSPWTSSISLEAVGYYLHGNWSNSTLTPSQIKANSTRLDFSLTQKLYGYSFSGSTITLAFVVLFLYVATVLVHISIMTFGTSWSSRAWKTLGEFYVLALQSPTPTSVLENTGGGVKVSKTWQARASVEELQDGNRVGILVRDSSQYDAADGSMAKVRPDWKYS